VLAASIRARIEVSGVSVSGMIEWLTASG
jgi:hypothetical protein